MRLTTILIAALVLVPAALATTAPRVVLTRHAPAVVSGSGFRAGEHVRVRVSNGTLVLSKRVTTTDTGTFKARFLRAISVLPCGQIGITATGTLGDHAAFKTAPQVCGTQPVD